MCRNRCGVIVVSSNAVLPPCSRIGAHRLRNARFHDGVVVDDTEPVSGGTRTHHFVGFVDDDRRAGQHR